MRTKITLLLLGSAGTALAQAPADRGEPALAVQRPPFSEGAGPSPQPPIVQVPAAADAEAFYSQPQVTDIRVEGADDLPAGEFTAALAPFVGHRLSADDMRDLLATVSGIARANGYSFARSTIPVQELRDGVLRVALDKGHVDQVRITGADNAVVRAVLSRLEGRAPRRQEIERQLMLAGDVPGVSLGDARFVREDGKGILVVAMTFDRHAARAWADNRGDRELGPVRSQVQIDRNGLLTMADQLTISGLVTPFQPDELAAASGRYRVQIGRSGTEFAVFGSLGHTRPGEEWRRFGSRGRSRSAGFLLARPLLRGRTVSLWLGGGGDYFAIDQRYAGALVRRDRLATANVSVNGYVPLAGGRLRGGIGLTRGLGILGATRPGDPLASRPGTSRHFTLLGGWANWEGDLAGPVSARLSVSGQASTDPLLAVQQIAIGGPAFGRAYEFSERSGDRGIVGLAEVRANLLDRSSGLLRWAQLYMFADAGRVSNLRNSFGTGALYSAGTGARFLLSKTFRVEAEAAIPVGADRFETDDRSPRISFLISRLF